MEESEVDQSALKLVALIRQFLGDDVQFSRDLDSATVEDELVAFAQHHRVLGILASAIGPGVSSGLGDDARGYQIRALRRSKDLCEITDTFANSGIRLIGLKGVTLSLQRYSALGIRYIGDTDVWISERDVESVHLLMRGLGYRDEHYDGLSQYYRKHYRRLRHHIEYVHSQTHSIVEIHWALMSQDSGCHLDFDTAFEAGHEIELSGRRLRSMSLLDEWLYLHAHASRHLWQRWQWVVDLAIIQQRQTVSEAEDLLALAEARGSERSVVAGMKLIHDLLGIQVPQLVHQSVEHDSSLQELCAIGKRALMGRPCEGARGAGGGERLRAQWALDRNLKSRLQYLQMICLNPDDWYRVKLPDGWLWLYAPMRLWFGIRRWLLMWRRKHLP